MNVKSAVSVNRLATMESINEKRGTNDIYYRCPVGTLIKLAADHEFYSIHEVARSVDKTFCTS